MGLIIKAFAEGVKAALRFFQGGGGAKAAAKGAGALMRNMEKAVRVASKIKK